MRWLKNTKNVVLKATKPTVITKGQKPRAVVYGAFFIYCTIWNVWGATRHEAGCGSKVNTTWYLRSKYNKEK